MNKNSVFFLIFLTTLGIVAAETKWGVSSGGSPEVFSVFDYGATGDGTTNDKDAIQNAVEAACTYTGSESPILDFTHPNGTAVEFRLGEAGDGFHVAGLVLDTNTCTRAVRFQGDCADQSNTKLLPGGDDGQALITICDSSAPSGGSCDSDTTDTSLAHEFVCLQFEDDDPWIHGGQNTSVYRFSSAISPTPAYGDTVTWPGSGNGEVIEWDATRNYLSLAKDDGDTWPTTSDLLTGDGGNWTGTAAEIIRGGGTHVDPDKGSNEGTHGIYMKPADNVRIERNVFVDLSDEAIDIFKNSDNTVVVNNTCTGISNQGEGGSCVSYDGSTGGVISENVCTGGKGSGTAASGSCFTISTNTSVAVGSVTLLNNTCTETGTGEDAIEACINLSPNLADLDDVVISSTTITTPSNSTDTAAINLDGGSGRIATVDVYDLTVTGGGRYLNGDTTQNDHDISFYNINWTSDNTSGTSPLTAANYYGGSITGVTNGAVMTISGNYSQIIQGVTFDCENSCVYLNSSGNQVLGNTFTDVGNGSGIDYAVREGTLGTPDNNVVNENVVTAWSSGGTHPFRVGTAADAGLCDGAGTGASSYCDDTRNTGDGTP